MKFGDIESQIFTGDALLVDGTGIVSDLIEIDTLGRFSHAGIFFRLTPELIFVLVNSNHPDITNAKPGDLWVGEMWLSKSFDTHPANKFLSISGGKYYLGVAPECVRSQPDKVLAGIVELIRTQPTYGLVEFPEIFFFHIFHIQVTPSKSIMVCSGAVEYIWTPCGVKFVYSLAYPADFDTLVAGVVQIEPEVVNMPDGGW